MNIRCFVVEKNDNIWLPQTITKPSKCENMNVVNFSLNVGCKKETNKMENPAVRTYKKKTKLFCIANGRPKLAIESLSE